MTPESDSRPGRRRRAAGSAAPRGSEKGAPDYRRCVWQPDTGWQPLLPEGTEPDNVPVAWCLPVQGGWAPIQPGDLSVSQSAPPAAQPDVSTPAAAAGTTPAPVVAQMPASDRQPTSAAAAPGGVALPPEVAAFYALLFSPMPPAGSPPAVPAPQGAPGAPGGEGGPSADAAAPSLWDSFRGFTARLGDALNQFVTNVSSLEVDTYTSTNPNTVHLDPDPTRSTGENLALLARTLVAFDGDTQFSLPAQRSAIDPALVQIHLQMVHEAQYNRAQFLQMMGDLGSQLLGVFKPK
ncbi:MAG TPA: hypothetical protein VGA61_00655 [Anaerolineae bacterium]